jgi:hypothetical protein
MTKDAARLRYRSFIGMASVMVAGTIWFISEPSEEAGHKVSFARFTCMTSHPGQASLMWMGIGFVPPITVHLQMA